MVMGGGGGGQELLQKRPRRERRRGENDYNWKLIALDNNNNIHLINIHLFCLTGHVYNLFITLPSSTKRIEEGTRFITMKHMFK